MFKNHSVLHGTHLGGRSADERSRILEAVPLPQEGNRDWERYPRRAVKRKRTKHLPLVKDRKNS